MKKLFISSAYVYPLCPLSLNHAKMFVVGDIIARNARKKGQDVIFPIAMHYSGNSAQNISKIFADFFLRDNTIHNDEEKRIFNLYKNIYNTPESILETFIHPLNILDFYSQEILWELKSLDISCDYEYSYTTKDNDFSIFVNTIVSTYEENNLLVNNNNGELALDYDNDEWKRKTIELLNRTEFIQSFHKNNISSAVKHVRTDWALLRKDGFGVAYKGKWIIDPMFDSEIFTIFDLYARFKSICNSKSINVEEFFRGLFKVLKNNEKSEDILINKIIDFLPCDIFISEEHLKNWIVKKLYSESFLLDKKYQTRKYFILGMGFLDGKQMSASKGHAILTKDLINQYGATKARLVILLGGGHPSKMYEYDKTLPVQADKLLNTFIHHYKYLLSIIGGSGYKDKSAGQKQAIEMICNNIQENIEKGYYRQAVIELLSILPREYQKSFTIETALILLSAYKKYSDILLPSLLNSFIKT